jgi:hypothetical protein
LAAALPAVAAAELRVLLDLAARAVVAELRVLRADKPRVALALRAVVVVLRVVLLAVVVELLLLSRLSFSAAMARTTPCPAPALTYGPVPRSR